MVMAVLNYNVRNVFSPYYPSIPSASRTDLSKRGTSNHYCNFTVSTFWIWAILLCIFNHISSFSFHFINIIVIKNDFMQFDAVTYSIGTQY